MDRKQFEKRFNALKNEASSWVTSWKEIRDLVCPERGSFDGEQPNQGRLLDHKKMLDGTANKALSTLAAGMTSGLTSPSRPWFKLGIPNNELMKIDAVKNWLSSVEELLMAIFSRSNIYSAITNVYEEVGGPGTAALMIEEDYDTVIRAVNFTVGEYFIGLGADGRVNAFARQFKMTVGQMVEMFGIDNVSVNVKTAFNDKKLDTWYPVCHLIERNTDQLPKMKDNKNMPFISVYWEEGSEKDTLRVSGYQEFPVMCPRWNTKTTSEVYGKGPGWKALGDVKMLQALQRKSLKALDKVIDPPVMVDSMVDGSDINLLPGGISRTGGAVGNAGMKAVYQINPDIGAVENKILQTKQEIKQAFFADLFMMMAGETGGNMTAREVVERHEEKLLILGPVLERLESELLDPLISRVFMIAWRAGIIPPPPREIAGMEYKVEYISMLAQAQKMVGITAVREVVGFATSLAAVVPEIIDKINFDAAVEIVSELNGGTSRIIRSDDEVLKIRDGRRKAQEQSQQAQQAQQMVSGAKVLADTKLNDDSALKRILDANGGQQ
jgi:hypothetical protein